VCATDRASLGRVRVANVTRTTGSSASGINQNFMSNPPARIRGGSKDNGRTSGGPQPHDARGRRSCCFFDPNGFVKQTTRSRSLMARIPGGDVRLRPGPERQLQFSRASRLSVGCGQRRLRSASATRPRRRRSSSASGSCERAGSLQAECADSLTRRESLDLPRRAPAVAMPPKDEPEPLARATWAEGRVRGDLGATYSSSRRAS
jgi:hypothetical protein